VKLANTSTIVTQLFDEYQVEGLAMRYTMGDFKRDFTRDHVHEVTAEERVHGLSPEECLAALPSDEVEAYLKRSRKKPATPRKKKPKHQN
jgi:hypothetical protein